MSGLMIINIIITLYEFNSKVERQLYVLQIVSGANKTPNTICFQTYQIFDTKKLLICVLCMVGGR